MNGAEVAEAFEIIGARGDDAHVASDRLNHEGGDLAGVFFEDGLGGAEVVVGNGDGGGGDSLGDTGGRGGAEGECAGAGFDEEAVDVAVVAADALYDEIALGGGAGEADGGHGGFGAGVDEADHFDGGEGTGDDLRELDFTLRWVRPKLVPFPMALERAATTRSLAWPAMSGP